MENIATIEDVNLKIQSLISQWDTVKTSTEKDILAWETEVLKTIFPHRFENIEIILKDMIQILTKNDKFWCPGSSDPNYFDYFTKKEFNSFMDYFTRALNEEKHASIMSNIENKTMIVPNECYVESFGKVEDVHKIISLKKSCEDVKASMRGLGINLDNYSFINHKLLLTFYHRIHAPVKGILERVIPVSKEEGIFGDNALWILDINTGDKGHVYFMLVGESEIQDFHFLVKEGQELNLFDELGNFNWGSQTVLFYDHTKFGEEVNVKANTHFFAGDVAI